MSNECGCPLSWIPFGHLLIKGKRPKLILHRGGRWATRSTRPKTPICWYPVTATSFRHQLSNSPPLPNYVISLYGPASHSFTTSTSHGHPPYWDNETCCPESFQTEGNPPLTKSTPPNCCSETLHHPSAAMRDPTGWLQWRWPALSGDWLWDPLLLWE